MKYLPLVSLLILCAAKGCARTEAHDVSNPSDIEAVSWNESVRIELVDGTRIRGHEVWVASDSLLFTVAADDHRTSSAALSEVVEASTTKCDPVGTVALVFVIAGLAVVFVAATAAAAWAAMFQD